MAEDLSAGGLQEKLKRLESLQELRFCNEDKVTTIERSAKSEEVKKVLQKNPDISKERSNLLQGGGAHTSDTHHHPCTRHPHHLPLLTHTHTITSHPHTPTHTTSHSHPHMPPPTPHTPSQAGLMSHLH